VQVLEPQGLIEFNSANEKPGQVPGFFVSFS
jgi:hypothetical protein